MKPFLTISLKFLTQFVALSCAIQSPATVTEKQQYLSPPPAPPRRAHAGEPGRDGPAKPSAQVYVNDDGIMADHVSGQDPWDLLVQAAPAANWVIMPADSVTCLTDPGRQRELPEELAEDAVVVDSGADLLAVIASR